MAREKNMKSTIRITATALLLAALLPLGDRADAAMLTYSLNNIGGNTWQYDYSFSTAQALPAYTGFSVFFAPDMADNLTEIAAPAGWNTQIVAPGSFVGISDGFYDALSINGLGAGETAGLFSLQINWLNDNTEPGSPKFEVYQDDPAAGPIKVVESGFASVVPVPAAGLLFGSGLVGLLLLVRRRVSAW